MTPTSTTHIPADRPMTAPVKTTSKNTTTSFAKDILSTIRCLVVDLVQQFNGGHPGTPMGAASIGLALWGNAMRFNPKDASWINRDRFVL
jgi:dihydroxyacetone synthase